MDVSIYISRDKDIRFDVLKTYGIEESDILKNEYGKPYTLKDICFSISHSIDYFVIAVAKENLGIDIEVGRDLDFKSISKRILKKEIEDKDEFFRSWVKHEAYVKYLGKSVFSNEELEKVAYSKIDIIENLYMGLVTKEIAEIEVIIW